MSDDYSRSNGPPPMKRTRMDTTNDGHWASAPTDRRGGGPGFPPMPPHLLPWRQNMNSGLPVDEIFDDTMSAARQDVSAFFQTATDEEVRGYNQSLKVFQK